jgi:hypothetical protein
MMKTNLERMKPKPDDRKFIVTLDGIVEHIFGTTWPERFTPASEVVLGGEYLVYEIGRKTKLYLTVKTNTPVERIGFPMFIPISSGDRIRAHIVKAKECEYNGQIYYVNREFDAHEDAKKIEIIKNGKIDATYMCSES